jgi:hypothetical protein
MFIRTFLESPSLLEGARRVIDYIAPLAVEETDLALEVTERTIDLISELQNGSQSQKSLLDRDLVHLSLTIYSYTFNEDEKTQAMDLFEHLLLLGSRTATRALEDWDRR